jgi:hypothetical protein
MMNVISTSRACLMMGTKGISMRKLKQGDYSTVLWIISLLAEGRPSVGSRPI